MPDFQPAPIACGKRILISLDAGGRYRQMLGMIIYKILRANEWAALENSGQTTGAPIDVTDGFIHFSTNKQVAETVQKHFAGASDLWIAALDSEKLSEDLRWEPSRGGALFPHLYRVLNLQDILWCKPLPFGPGGFEFPNGVL